MRFMYFLGLVICAVGSLQAQGPDSNSAIFRVAEAERNFSRQSVAIGRVQAFRDNLADQSVIFQPDPINGKTFYAGRVPSPVLLTWEPEFVDVAASEDLGVSTGPWEMKDYSGLQRPDRFGYYVSLWKRQSDGTWKVVVDMGNGVEEKSREPVRFGFRKGADRHQPYKPVNRDEVKKQLIQRDVDFSAAYAADPRLERYRNNLAADARLVRMAHYPATQLDSINALLRLSNGLSWMPIEGDVSLAGDFGYVYGTYTAQEGNGHYVHVWRKDGGEWRLLVDVQLPRE